MCLSENLVERVANVLPSERIGPVIRVVIETHIFDDSAIDNVAVGVSPDPHTALSVAIPTAECNKCVVLPLLKRGLENASRWASSARRFCRIDKG